nr:beta-propeller fold lactonase family protein [Terriglobales bacterium]
GRSNTISAFTINGNGSLTLVGTPLHSGGSQPASISLLEGALQNGNILVVVINKSSDPGQTNQAAPNMVSFTSTPAGVLTANATSKIVYPKGSSPSQAVVGKGKLVMVDEFLASPSQIGMYRIHSNGTFDTITSVPVPQGATLFLGLVASPVGNYLYAALPEQSLIAIYSYDTTTGAMTLVSTVATTGLLPCWLDVSKDGTRLYSGDTESSSISVFDVSNPTAPAFLQKLVLTNEVGNGQPWNVRIDPTGKFLYAVTGVGLHAINIQPDGTLLELATPTLLDVPSNTFPYGLATVLK